MSEVLARLRVRETAGIRRFLYPLKTMIELPAGIDTSSLGWSATRGDAVPLQVTSVTATQYRLDFALSLAPLEEREFALITNGFSVAVNDPLILTQTDAGGLESQQKSFKGLLTPEGDIEEVIYDGVSHLVQPSHLVWPSHHIHILYPGHETLQDVETTTGGGALSAWVSAKGTYHTGSQAKTLTEFTACKSWVTQTHLVQQPDSIDLFQFGLQLIPTNPILLCDFGVGGGIYGKLQPGPGGSLALTFEFTDSGATKWRLAATDEGGIKPQVNYKGSVGDGLESQLWFHVLDADKSLAVAITKIPRGCCELAIHLSPEGKVAMTYELRDAIGPAEFGVCYHFLNDVPAIAAATNPQSILLPPMVEVMPRDLEGWRE